MQMCLCDGWNQSNGTSSRVLGYVKDCIVMVSSMLKLDISTGEEHDR